MRPVIFLYKDDENKINYYYNLSDNLVYTSDNSNNKLTLIGLFSIIIGFMVYLAIAFSCYYFKTSKWVLLIIGVVFGFVISLIANSTIKDIFNSKGLKLEDREIKKLYLKNKRFRYKYLILVVLFLVLTFLAFVFYKRQPAFNFILLTSVIMAAFLFFLMRPLCLLKFLKRK